MNINDQITCQIKGIQNYGVFVNCGDYHGLIHISEVSNKYVRSLTQLFSIGDDIEVIVLDVDKDEKRLKLSYKQALNIHERIIEDIDVKIGFHSLQQALPKWLKSYKEKNEK